MYKPEWRHYRTRSNALAATGFVWLIAILAALPHYWFARLDFGNNTNGNGNAGSYLELR